MKIAICSDSHDNLINIDKFLNYCNEHEIETILHCGDWCAPAMLRYFRENFDGEIYGVYGNVHGDDLDIKRFAKDYKIIIKEDELKLEIENIKIILTHYPDKAEKLAARNSAQLIFYGHDHKPWMKKVGKIFIANPGTLAGMFQRATFATYDTKTKILDLMILDQLKNKK